MICEIAAQSSLNYLERIYLIIKYGFILCFQIDSPIGQIPDVYREEARNLFWGSPTYSYSNGSGSTGLSLNGLSIGNPSSSSSSSSSLFGSSSSSSGSLYSSGTGSLLGSGSLSSTSPTSSLLSSATSASSSPSSLLSHSASTSNLSLLGRERAMPNSLPLGATLTSNRGSGSERVRGSTTASVSLGRRESSSLAMGAPLRHAASSSLLAATSYASALRSTPRYSSTFYRLGF